MPQILKMLSFDTRSSATDNTGLADVGNNDGVAALSLRTGYNGGLCLATRYEDGSDTEASGSAVARLDLGAAQSHIILFCRWRAENDLGFSAGATGETSWETPFQFLSSTTQVEASIGIVSDKFKLVFDEGNISTLGTTSSAPDTLTADTWYDIEIEILTGASGYVTMRRTATTYTDGSDMQEILNVSDNINDIRYINFSGTDVNTVEAYHNFDDIVVYIPDGTGQFAGAYNVEEAMPNADGTVDQWTTSTDDVSVGSEFDLGGTYITSVAGTRISETELQFVAVNTSSTSGARTDFRLEHFRDGTALDTNVGSLISQSANSTTAASGWLARWDYSDGDGTSTVNVGLSGIADLTVGDELRGVFVRTIDTANGKYRAASVIADTTSFNLIDSTAADDLTYIESTAQGIKSIYEFALPTFTGNLKGLQLEVRASKVEEDNEIDAVYELSGVETSIDGTQNIDSTAFSVKTYLTDLDMTASDANALQIGIKT